MRLSPGKAGLVLAIALSGCAPSLAPQSTAAPPERPARAQPPEPELPPRSTHSLDLERYYARVQNDLLGRGLMRTDGGGVDTPFDTDALAENFVQIALFDEYTEANGTLVASPTASSLRRWSVPVRVQLTFGASIPEEKRRFDRAAVSSYTRRLARATSHTISTVRDGGNFHVLVLHEEERAAYGDRLKELVPGIGDIAVRTITEMPRSTFCLVFAFSEGSNSSDYVNAIAVVRGEHPDLLRLSCIQEELAQGMGLANDSPRARPSIFNDDEEFALLTPHDELLLTMLYDPRLRTGMRSEEAGPIAEQIAGELLHDGQI